MKESVAKTRVASFLQFCSAVSIISLVLILQLPMFCQAETVAIRANLTSFIYAGEIKHHEYMGNWIEGGWDVKIDAKLEKEEAPAPGKYVRFYSIKSVSFLICLQYFSYANSSNDFISEIVPYQMDGSNFDLSFSLYDLSTYKYSYIIEYKGYPNPGDYSYLIFLKYNEKKTIRTPMGSTLKLGGGVPGSGGGFSINHISYAPDPGMLSFWPAGAWFSPPKGYHDVLHLKPNLNVFEYNLQHKEVGFWDFEQQTRLVSGAVADGGSRVIVKVNQVQNSADVTFPPGDGRWVGPPKLEQGVWRRVWEAPADFGVESGQENTGRRTIRFQSTIDGQNREAPFELYRAPVVLLHGLWATSLDTWPKFKAELKNQGFPLVHDPSYPNYLSFNDNASVVPDAVRNALAEAKNIRLAAKKVDIVAHSMGGDLAKLYGKGLIRRLVTIGTPHFGSPFANFVVNRICPFKWVEGPASAAFGHPLACGAINDLRTTSCKVPGDLLPVPTLAINGISINNAYPAGLSGALCTLLELAAGISGPADLHKRIFLNDTSDWIVSGTSQEGGLPSNKFFKIGVDWHLTEPLDPNVIKAAIDFLNKPSSELAAISPAIDIPSQARALMIPDFQDDGASVQAATLKITSPTSGTTFAPGDTIQVKVSAPPATKRVLVMLSGGAFAVDRSSPYQLAVPLPRESLGNVVIAAFSADAKGITGSTYITVNAKTGATLKGLKLWPDSAIYLKPQKSLQLSVTGVFSDGVRRNITLGQFGCLYKSERPAVANISKDGLINTLSPGYSLITVSKGSFFQQIPVMVSP